MIDFDYTLLDPGDERAEDLVGLQQAYDAARNSDHRTQVGAVCGAGQGWNRAFHPDKTDLRIHAETAAIIACARHGSSTQGRTLYAPWAACGDCANHIAAAGVSRVVVHHQLMQMTRTAWEGAVHSGLETLRHCGVVVEAVDHLFKKTIRFNGEEVTV
jgi:deoxycytidylate deaminase